MSKNWKDALLSSGLPLEYEVTRILLQAGFYVSGEYPYSRRSDRSSEEFSVDLRANHFLEQGCDNGGFKAQLATICECKYRNPDKSWIFVPDLNDPDFSPSSAHALRSFPNYTCYTFDHARIVSFCCQYPPAMKGIELQERHGEAFERDIRHAVNQLRYALPELVAEYAREANAGHPTDCLPFFILPLLVTNAPLRMLREKLTLHEVLAAKDLADISDVVEAVDLYSPFARDFRQHSYRVFAELAADCDGARPGNFARIARYQKGKRGRLVRHDDTGLAGGWPESGAFEQFLVVNEAALKGVLESAKTAIYEALKESAQVVFPDDESQKTVKSSDGSQKEA